MIDLIRRVEVAYVDDMSNNHEDGELRLSIVLDRDSIVFALRFLAYPCYRSLDGTAQAVK